MSVLVYIETADGSTKKASVEAAAYGAKIAEQLGTEAVGLAVGEAANLADLGNYGLSKVLQVSGDVFNSFDAAAHTDALAAGVESAGASVIVTSHNYNGKAVSARLSARLKAGMVAGATSLPDTADGFKVQKSVFSGKGIATYEINTDVKIVSLNPNSYPVEAGSGTAAVEALAVTSAGSGIKVKEVKKQSSSIPLSEAELVVSAGRGLKGPENWGMVEEMAGLLGAATACSRAVSDVDWRPHHEHVGQTGLTVRPNLYIAIAISGAIQHLAGVNSSKTIVVINKDPEAPFFKSADYGIVGDAFEVVPKLNEALKKYKGA